MLEVADRELAVIVRGECELIGRRRCAGPGHVGGDLQEMGGFACEVHAQPAVWTDASGTPWVFIADICGSLYAVKIVVTNGKPAMQMVYSHANLAGTSPTVANGVLYTAYQHTISALDPETGAVLWSSTGATAGGTIGDLIKKKLGGKLALDKEKGGEGEGKETDEKDEG